MPELLLIGFLLAAAVMFVTFRWFLWDSRTEPQRTPLEDASEQVEEVRRKLMTALATIQDRDAAIVSLEARLAAAELQSLQAPRPSGGENDDRFHRLRALILSELHPDHAPPGSVDRALRGEVFKAFWPKMEEIERAP